MKPARLASMAIGFAALMVLAPRFYQPTTSAESPMPLASDQAPPAVLAGGHRTSPTGMSLGPRTAAESAAEARLPGANSQILREAAANIGSLPAPQIVSASASTAPSEPTAATLQTQRAQELLNRIGRNVGTVDGIPGARTTAQITAFQREARLPANGRLDGATLAALESRANKLNAIQITPASALASAPVASPVATTEAPPATSAAAASGSAIADGAPAPAASPAAVLVANNALRPPSNMSEISRGLSPGASPGVDLTKSADAAAGTSDLARKAGANVASLRVSDMPTAALPVAGPSTPVATDNGGDAVSDKVELKPLLAADVPPPVVPKTATVVAAAAPVSVATAKPEATAEPVAPPSNDSDLILALPPATPKTSRSTGTKIASAPANEPAPQDLRLDSDGNPVDPAASMQVVILPSRAATGSNARTTASAPREVASLGAARPVIAASDAAKEKADEKPEEKNASPEPHTPKDAEPAVELAEEKPAAAPTRVAAFELPESPMIDTKALGIKPIDTAARERAARAVIANLDDGPGETPRTSQREDVRRLQAHLIAAGAYGGNADGIWGGLTSDALKEFQREHDLKPTGKPDGDTWKRLHTELLSASDRAVASATPKATSTKRAVASNAKPTAKRSTEISGAADGNWARSGGATAEKSAEKAAENFIAGSSPELPAAARIKTATAPMLPASGATRAESATQTVTAGRNEVRVRVANTDAMPLMPMVPRPSPTTIADLADDNSAPTSSTVVARNTTPAAAPSNAAETSTQTMVVAVDRDALIARQRAQADRQAKLRAQLERTQTRIAMVMQDERYEVARYASSTVQTANALLTQVRSRLDDPAIDADAMMKSLTEAETQLEQAKRNSAEAKARAKVADVDKAYREMKKRYSAELRRSTLIDTMAKIDTGYRAMQDDFKKGNFDPILDRCDGFRLAIEMLTNDAAKLYVDNQLARKEVSAKIGEDLKAEILELQSSNRHVEAAKLLEKSVPPVSNTTSPRADSGDAKAKDGAGAAKSGSRAGRSTDRRS